ncbi:hypothetical protein ACT29H_04775 [Thermophagus sp. OGC60D27]|uniref:hypothetical protein n=1 Tax=Thermophagus sp. OGC60D27 TaxID=3458415 RepID=UPI0040376048
MKTKSLFPILLMLVFLACNENETEVYDRPFIHIMYEGASSIKVSSKANVLKEYNIYLSSKPLSQNLVVDYEVLVGNGLEEGVDFELITQGNTMTFLPGIYEMPVRIKWLPNALDPSKDNSIVIRLTGNNLGFTLGLPGPDHHQTELKITKTE